MRAEELIRRYWVARQDRATAEAGVAVCFSTSEADVLWLDIPRNDAELTKECDDVPQLADLLLLSRRSASRSGEVITEDAGPWHGLVVELKRPAWHEEDAQKAAMQVGNLAALVFGGRDWQPTPHLLGLVVYRRQGGAPTDYSAIKRTFKAENGFALRFVPTDRDDVAADLAVQVVHAGRPDQDLLSARRAGLVRKPALAPKRGPVQQGQSRQRSNIVPKN